MITGFSFTYLAWRLLRTREDVAMRKAARTLFNYSLSYLFIVFLAFMTDNLLTRFGGFI
ncbi:protoheme IX farnesyltransferase [compost metagenome]